MFAIVLATAGLAGWQQDPAAPDVRALGPQIGTRAPAFSLADQNGRIHTLSSIAGPKGAILVFFRSADW